MALLRVKTAHASPLPDRHVLSLMGVTKRHGDRIPFTSLLQQFNETHRNGLDVGEE